jgi:dTMP kinase
MWISIDGVEGTGKTTIARRLADALSATHIPEFSEGPLGTALRQAVEASPYHFSVSLVARSLLFLGDFMEQYEGQIRPALLRGEVVVSDRGYLSKYAYQCVNLAEQYGTQRACQLVGQILQPVHPPNATIYLVASNETMEHRLRSRNWQFGASRLEYFGRVNQIALSRLTSSDDLPGMVLNSDGSIDSTLSAIMKRIHNLIA